MADAVPLLRHRDAGPAHPLWHQPVPVPEPEGRAMNNVFRILTGIVLIMALIYLLMAMIQPGDGTSQFQLTEFGKLPVVKGGRVQPLDSVARNSLMVISSRQEFKDDKGATQPAIKWLA